MTGILGGLAQLAMTRAYALERAARLGAVSYLGIMLTHVFGVLLLAESPGPAEAIGAALIVSAGLGLALAAMRDARTTRTTRA